MQDAYDAALATLVNFNPEIAARNCGFRYQGSKEEGTFLLNFLATEIMLEHPSFEGKFLPEDKIVPRHITALVIYHLAKCNGTPLTGDWITYADLPGGTSYVDAFRNYTSKPLQNHFGNDLEALRGTAETLTLEQISMPAADLAIKILVMPKVPVVLVYRAGDDEFPPSADFLFDTTAKDNLPSDCYAMLCAWLTQTLIKRRYFYES